MSAEGRSRFHVWLVVALLLGPLVVGTLSVTTATNSVPNTKLGATTLVTGVTELRPYVCSGIAVTTLVTGTRTTLSGTGGSDLILGKANTRNIDGKGGNDCIAGGSGARSIIGGSGNDVCIGPWAATFQSCETVIRP